MGRFKKAPKAPKLRPKPLPPPKLRKPLRAKARKPQKAPAKAPRKAPPKKPAKKARKRKIPKPPKVWIRQMFGKTRKQLIRPITSEDRKRIKEAKAVIHEIKLEAERTRHPFGPSEVSPLGYEYFELLSALEKISAHDAYTLCIYA